MARMSETDSDPTGPPTGHEPDTPTAPDRPRRDRRTALMALIIMLVLLLLLGAGLVVAAFVASERLAGQVERIPDAFAGLDEERRPDKPAGVSPGAESLNVLLAGVDAREDRGSTLAEGLTGERTDTIMILHVSGDRQSAALISIPRDSWVDVPGHGTAKINAAHSWGGYPLFIETVEQLTGLRIDHLAIISFNGFRDLTDALGGIDISFPAAVEGSSGQVFEAGDHTLDGEQALDYVRARYNLPQGDFDRVRRQQNLLRALMRQTLSGDTITNPFKLNDVLDALTQNLAVDEDLSTGEMRGIALELRHMRARDVVFMTAPVRGTGREGSQAVVYLDPERFQDLFAAVRADGIEEYLDDDPHADVLSDSLR